MARTSSKWLVGTVIAGATLLGALVGVAAALDSEPAAKPCPSSTTQA